VTLRAFPPKCLDPKAIETNTENQAIPMDLLTSFGFFAVASMLACYALEDYSAWFILAFAGSCALGSVYGFLQGAWPFGLVEAIWSLVSLRRWYIRLASNKYLTQQSNAVDTGPSK
jgi:hypothetical protein